MNLALWIVQILLATAFGMAGFMKLSMSVDQLIENGMTYVSYTPAWLVRFVGVCEIAGAIGLVLPSLLRIRPKLTGIAAEAFVILMVIAAGMHLTHEEAAVLPANLVLGALAAFVAWGRLRRLPIEPRK